jgi:Na+-translocating ferredoxin:NAD+ oxidoreductase subunit C
LTAAEGKGYKPRDGDGAETGPGEVQTMRARFAGGVHPDPRKTATERLPIVELPPPPLAVIPLQQHIGPKSRSLVKPGDRVLRGQKIGEGEGFISAHVHASIAGKVKEVGLQPHALGSAVEAVVIENDGTDAPASCETHSWETSTPEALRGLIREAGIVGLGGATFPTHVKLDPPKAKKIDALVINGAECEPYLTADHRLMVERGADIVGGARILARILGVNRILVGIEANKPDAVASLRLAGGQGVEVASLPVIYPQGAEKQLIKALLGREVSPPPGLPMDAGVVVQNVGTCAAVYEAVCRGRPLIDRVVTVAGGGIGRPGNFRARIGTPLRQLAEACGGLSPATVRLVMGGPMMGLPLANLDAPVIKGTSGLLALTRAEVPARRAGNCIRCGRCVRVCPMGLLPATLALFAQHQLYERAAGIDAMACIECGSCAYVCPAAIPLVQHIRLAKSRIAAARHQRAQKEQEQEAAQAAVVA